MNSRHRTTLRHKIYYFRPLRQGVVKVLDDAAYSPSLARRYTVASLITGYGVAEAVRHYFTLWPGKAVAGKRIVI